MSEPQSPRTPRKRRICGYVAAVLLLVAVVSNWTWARLPDTPPAPAGSKYATVDGRKIHYVETPGREPAVLMVHGLPGTWGDFDRVAAELEGRRTIRVSRPGYAYSSAGYVPFEEQVTLLHGLSDQLRLDDPVIAGHSYGGALVLRYGARYPDDIAGIVAVAPVVDPDGRSAKKQIQARFVRVTRVPVVKQLVDATVGDLFRRYSAHDGGTEAFAPDARQQEWLDRSLALNMRHQDLDAWSQEMLNWDDAVAGLRREFAAIRSPLWVIQGQDDNLVAASGVTKAMAELPQADLKVLPGGHMQTDVHPREVAAAITAAAGERRPVAVR